MLRTYKDWIEEKRKKDEPVGIATAYKAAQENTIKHYEANAIATTEYYSSVLSRTSSIDLKIATAIVELADSFPNIGERFPLDFPQKMRNMADLLDHVRSKKVFK